jgi:hypothetical protein
MKMTITLTDEQIREAIAAYLTDKNLKASPEDVTIKAHRNPKGTFTAEVGAEPA